MASTTVTFWPQEVGWECDCKTSEEVCPHVAAAVIAVRRAGQEGKRLPAPKAPPAHVGYRFTRVERSLVFERLLLRGDRTQVLEGSLAGIATRTSRGTERWWSPRGIWPLNAPWARVSLAGYRAT